MTHPTHWHRTAEQHPSLSDLALAKTLLHQSSRSFYGDGISETLLSDVGQTGTCKSSTDCTEANLDVQYALACSPPGQVKLMAPEFQYLDGVNPLLDLTHQLSHDPTPPPVISVSYGSSEADVDRITLDAFDTEAKLLSLQVSAS